jgi:hypothetical protein
MVESHYPSVTELMSQQRTRRVMLMTALIAAVTLVFGAMGALLYFNVSGAVTAVVGLAIWIMLVLPVAIWQNPKLGFYILFAGAMFFESVSNGYGVRTDVPTSFVPFFWNLNNLGYHYGTAILEPFKFSIAELLMVTTFTVWIVQAIVTRTFRFEKGAFFWAFAAYIVMVTLGWIHGVSTGGDVTMALWEVRPQFHFFAAYLIAANLIREKKDVYPVLWLTIIFAGLKGLIGINAYIAMGGIVGEQGILMHEESLFFNLIIFALFITWLADSDHKLKWWAVVLAPACIFSALQNQRRSGIAAFIVAFVPLMPILWAILLERRAQVQKFLIGFALFSTVYLPVAWNGKGAWALPARAIRSNSDPNERDQASDYYRLAESINVKNTRDEKPWTGIGYGKPFRQDIWMPGVDQFDSFLKYLPHNSILWVWMRIGHFGFFVFLMLFATICVKGVHILRKTQDRLLQTVGVFGIITPLMLFTFGKYDLAMTNYRVLIMTGCFVGILSVLPKLDPKRKEEEREGEGEEAVVRSPERVPART